MADDPTKEKTGLGHDGRERSSPDKSADTPPADIGENFGLDAEPGTKGEKASGAGLTANPGGVGGSHRNSPNTYKPGTNGPGEVRTGGGGL